MHVAGFKSHVCQNFNRTNLPRGSFHCGQDCATCPYITNGLKEYTRHITSHITCNTTNLIYMIQCNRCHLHYIGEAKRCLKDRFNEHRCSVAWASSLKTMVSQKCNVIRESFLIDLGETLEPHGLNRRDLCHRSQFITYSLVFIYI